MSRQTPPVTARAWCSAWFSLIGVISVTILIALGIVYRGEQTRATLAPDRFDERWQIRSGVAVPDRLVLQPTADTIGVALRPNPSASNDFTLQTRLTFDRPTGAAGLIVQADDADHFLAFLISPDGYFRLSDYRNGAWIDRVAWRAWPHIRRDSAPNVLRAECRAATCTFFVNDEWTWQAEGIAATSQVGVVAAAQAAVFDQQQASEK